MASIDIYVPERHRVVIHGKVQGVGFRLWLRNVANSLSLFGSCRQLEDGTCEAIVQGERRFIKQFIVACKRGPAEATVERIESSTLPVDPQLGSFLVER
ncbi:MAG: acylphosphatase [Dehalococcoidia bacterium]